MTEVAGLLVWLALLALPALLGIQIWRRLRARRPIRAVQAGPAFDPGLPDWGHADSPLLSRDQLGALMHDIARRARISQHVLPHVGPIGDGEGAYVDRGASYYLYVGLERGAVSFEHRTPVADRLMYRVFRDRTWMVAAGYMAGSPTLPEQDPERIAEKQQAILARIDPRWANQFAHERGRKAGG